MYKTILDKLGNGETVSLRPRGNSMTPLIKSGQQITLAPANTAVTGDIVLAKVRGRYFIHKVTAVRRGQYQISNNHGHVNGWTKQIYGKVIL